MTDTAKGADGIAEDLREDYEIALAERDNPEREPSWREAMATIVGYLERISKAEQALAQAQAEVLSLKSRNEDARLEYQTLADERDALRKRFYNQSTDMNALKLELATARELLREYRRSMFDHATCTAPNRCDLCRRTDAHLNP